MMLRTALWSLIFTAACCCRVHAQAIITNGDGSALTTRYCREDKDYLLGGSPAGGTFSGCGVLQQNGQWYLNPFTATQDITVFPYQCSLTYTVNGNTTSKNILIWKPVAISPPLQDSSTCNGYFYLHATTLYAGDYDYQWSPAVFADHPDSSNTTGNIPATQIFVITARDVTSGCMGSDTVTITRNPAPQLTVSNDTVIKARQQIRLYATGAATYQWSPSQWLDDPAAASPVARPEAPVRYRVVGSNEYGCSDTGDVFIDIYKDFFIPNAFSPNGDGVNDVFRIENYGHQALKEFRIFNRWGQEVFYTMDGTRGWDGTKNGQPLDAGNYFYRIRLVPDDKQEEVYHGDVMLVR